MSCVVCLSLIFSLDSYLVSTAPKLQLSSAGFSRHPMATLQNICTSPWATYPPPPPPQWYGPPTPPHHPHLGDDAGNAGDAVQYCASPAASVPDPLLPREPTPPHLSQHPTLNQTTLQPLLNPNPKPKSTKTQTHPKPTANQP